MQSIVKYIPILQKIKDNWSRNFSNNIAIKNCLFGVVKLTGHPTKSNFIYYEYEIASEKPGNWSFLCNKFANSSSRHSHNRKNIFLVISDGPTDYINDSVVTVENMFSVNFTKSNLLKET